MIKKLSTYGKILNEMAPYLKEVEESINANLLSKIELVKTIDRYVIHSGGKRFRPMLMIITAKMCGYKGNDFARLGTVIEYLHSATLLHDDVLDKAELRRGNPSANIKWGNAAAVLSGDYLFSQAFTLLVKHYHKDITLVMLQSAIDMIDGEVLELSMRHKADMAEKDYFAIIGMKTASLIAASCSAGALMGEAGPEQAEAMYRFGHSLGMAFQIIDDVLDFTGEEKRFGKVPGGDLREGCVTLPLIKLMRKIPDHEREWLKSLIASDAISAGDVSRVIGLIHDYRAGNDAFAHADRHVAEAREFLRDFQDNPYRRMLEAAADYVVSRQV